MAISYLKRATMTAATSEMEVRETVSSILTEIEKGGEPVALEYCRKLDQWSGDIIVSEEQIIDEIGRAHV